MLHGPWIAAMMRDYLIGVTGGGGALSGPVDLSSVIDIYDNDTTWDGTWLSTRSDWNYGDTLLPVTLDMTATYDVEIDYNVTTGTDGAISMFSSSANDDPMAAQNSNWFTFHQATGLSGSGTLTFQIGPGIDQWDEAVGAGEPCIIFELGNKARVSAVRITGGSAGGEAPAPKVVKAMAMASAYAPTAGASFRSGLTGELSGGGYTPGGVAVSGLSINWDSANSRVKVTCDLIDFGDVTATDVAAVVFYVDNGSASSDRVLWTDVFTPVAATGALTYQPHADGAMEIRV